MGKQPVFCFLLCLLAGISSGTGNCEEQQIETGADVIDQSSSERLSLEQQKDQLLGLLAQVDERYGDAAASIKSIEEQIGIANLKLAKIRKEISAQQEQIDKLDAELSGQVKAAFAMGQQDKLKLILNQQDPILSGRMMVYYDYINRSRLKKLTNLRQTVNYLDQLDRDKQKEADLLEKNREQRKSEQATLNDVRKQRDKLIAQLNDDDSSDTDRFSLLKDSENKLISLIQALENEEGGLNEETVGADSEANTEGVPATFPKLEGDFLSLKGKLPLPVRGKLVNMVGSSSAEANWKGVLIDAKEGAEIKAITKGKVAYSGTLKGYGLLIIVEHDRKYMSLYAHNQSLFKHKGDSVEAGDVIASVGQSGGRSKPGLYFEIRQNGKAVDPLQWCRN